MPMIEEREGKGDDSIMLRFPITKEAHEMLAIMAQAHGQHRMVYYKTLLEGAAEEAWSEFVGNMLSVYRKEVVAHDTGE